MRPTYQLSRPLLLLLLLTALGACKKNNNDPGGSTTITGGDFTVTGSLRAGSTLRFSFSVPTIKEHWDFGDGTTVDCPPTNRTPIKHSYQIEGTYTVTVIVNDDIAHAVTKVLNITPAPPNYSFSYTGIPVVGDTIYFHSHSSLSADSTYKWVFGDGSTSADTAPYHVYTASGTFSVSFYVNGRFGSFLWDKLRIYKDPLYTSEVAGIRTYHARTRGYGSTGDTTHATLPDTTLQVLFTNKITLSFNYTKFTFDDQKSNANELYYVYGPFGGDRGEIYYNRVKDSISIYSCRWSGGAGMAPRAVEYFFNTL